MTAAGTPDAAADHFADHMTEAHLRGVDTHGLRRVGPYLDRIVQGGVDAAAEPSFTGRGALIQVDGLNGLGHHVAAEAADAASRAAKELGVGAAWVRGGNHFGFAGYYAVRMAARGQVGLVGSNGQVCVGPAGSTRALLSNDPLALAAPIDQDDFIELDMAASVTSRANIVQAAREGKALPEGWAQDDRGRPTTDPEAALVGSLLAFGGHKGWALLFALEVLIGVLDGGAYADQVVSKEEHPNAPENLSQFFLAIDLDQLQGRSDFQARLGDLIDRMNQLPLAPDADPPRYPGRTRWNLRRRRLREGVPIQPRDYQSFYEAGQRFGIRID
jgi:LDH2 family malate/lactate/ureidoglycolate dehydrogenase